MDSLRRNEMVAVSSGTDSDNDEEQRKVDELSEQEQRKRLSKVNQAIAALKQEAPPSPPRPPSPPTPPTPPSLKRERPWGPPETEDWEKIGDWLKDTVPQPELIRDSPAVICVNNQTLAIIEKLGLPWNFLKHDANVPVLAERLGFIKSDINNIERSRKSE